MFPLAHFLIASFRSLVGGDAALYVKEFCVMHFLLCQHWLITRAAIGMCKCDIGCNLLSLSHTAPEWLFVSCQGSDWILKLDDIRQI